MSQQPVRVAVIGLGYFSQFHLNAWSGSDAVKLVGVCDNDPAVLTATQERLGSAGLSVAAFTDTQDLLQQTQPDIIDIVAPPPVHAQLVRQVLAQHPDTSHGENNQVWIICQKPFCNNLEQARTVAAEIAASGARLAIHENFRFQPWYRTLKERIDSGALGQIHQCRFSLRPGDGRGHDAYLTRQPAFQSMQQFLIRETGVHFIDLFRWLLGDVKDIYADLRQLNPVIAGEDAGMFIMNHTNGAVSVFDGNRLQDHAAENHRLTMGELHLETDAAVLRIDGFGRLWQRKFNDNTETELPLTHAVAEGEFGGGCVDALINHVITAWHHDRKAAHQQYKSQPENPPFLENEIDDYLSVLALSEACYESARLGIRISLADKDKP